MPPTGPQSNVGNAANLPPVPPQGVTVGALQPEPGQMPVPPAPGGSMEEQAIAKAQSLVIQNSQNPYQLAAGMQQLKATYLAQKYNITANPET